MHYRIFLLTTFFASLLFTRQALSQGNIAMEFWSAYDPHATALNAETILSWEDDLGNYELVRFDLGKLEGTNRTASPVIAAYFGYPKSATSGNLAPGIVQIHGGGQRANKGRVADWVKLGYACISINWGGKVLEQPNTPNTDWDGLANGFDRPGASTTAGLTHHNLVAPSPHTLYKEHHLLNSSWNLIAMSARRALTFLEEHPFVDGDKLGVEGHSMGGRSTVLTSIDPRVKASSPSVGGSGFLYSDMWGLPGSARRMTNEDGLELYSQVVSAQSYWPFIKAPVMFLQASNDFNAPNDLVARGMSLLPPETERVMTIAPHLNHRFTTETSAARFVWMEAHLKGSLKFPKISQSKLILDSPNKIPVFEVEVNDTSGLAIEKVEIYYGYARDPRIRFWRSCAGITQNGNHYSAPCPIFDINEPLFAFANISYRLPMTLPARPGHSATDLMKVTSQYQSAYPEAIQSAGIMATEKQNRLVDDFSQGWQDWYQLNPGNPHHWFYATRKVIDPTWMGPKGSKLAFEVITTEPGNQLAIGMEVNTWQGYTGRQRDSFHAVVALLKAGSHHIELSPADFKNKAGNPMNDWDEATELTFTPAKRIQATPSDWSGLPATLKKLRWIGGSDGARAYPHQLRGDRKPPENRGFDNEFQKAIDDSVELEELDENKVKK